MEPSLVHVFFWKLESLLLVEHLEISWPAPPKIRGLSTHSLVPATCRCPHRLDVLSRRIVNYALWWSIQRQITIGSSVDTCTFSITNYNFDLCQLMGLLVGGVNANKRSLEDVPPSGLTCHYFGASSRYMHLDAWSGFWWRADLKRCFDGWLHVMPGQRLEAGSTPCSAQTYMHHQYSIWVITVLAFSSK